MINNSLNKLTTAYTPVFEVKAILRIIPQQKTTKFHILTLTILTTRVPIPTLKSTKHDLPLKLYNKD